MYKNVILILKTGEKITLKKDGGISLEKGKQKYN